MKRLLPLISIICILSLILSGCSLISLRPSTLTPICYDVGLNILTITDEYLDGKISPVVAAGELQSYCKILGSHPTEADSRDQDVANYSEVLCYLISKVAEGETNLDDDIISNRNYLADLLGKNSRS